MLTVGVADGQVASVHVHLPEFLPHAILLHLVNHHHYHHRYHSLMADITMNVIITIITNITGKVEFIAIKQQESPSSQPSVITTTTTA